MKKKKKHEISVMAKANCVQFLLLCFSDFCRWQTPDDPWSLTLGALLALVAHTLHTPNRSHLVPARGSSRSHLVHPLVPYLPFLESLSLKAPVASFFYCLTIDFLYNFLFNLWAVFLGWSLEPVICTFRDFRLLPLLEDIFCVLFFLCFFY